MDKFIEVVVITCWALGIISLWVASPLVVIAFWALPAGVGAGQMLFGKVSK